MEIKRAELSSSTKKSPAKRTHEWLVDNIGLLVISIICIFFFLGLVFLVCGICNLLATNVARESGDGAMAYFIHPFTGFVKLVGSAIIVWVVLRGKNGIR